MALVGIFAHGSGGCRIQRCVEAVWIDTPSEVFFYYDILLDNSNETTTGIDRLDFYFCLNLTGDLHPTIDTLFKNRKGVRFDSDLSDSFSREIPENRFLTKIDQAKRVVDRNPPLGSGWRVPELLRIAQNVIREQIGRVCGSMITVAFEPRIEPGEKYNFRLLFKLGTATQARDFITVSTRRWSGVFIHNLMLRGLDRFALGDRYPRTFEEMLPIDEYMLLAILPPDAEDLELSPSPAGISHHDFRMLSSELGPYRQVIEWHVRSEEQKPLRVRVKYVIPREFGIEFVIILFSLLVALVSLAIGIWSFYR